MNLMSKTCFASVCKNENIVSFISANPYGLWGCLHKNKNLGSESVKIKSMIRIAVVDVFQFWDAMSSDVVPVVYGGANYSRYAPPYSYINVDDFTSIEQLGQHLRWGGRIQSYKYRVAAVDSRLLMSYLLEFLACPHPSYT